ncbi:MAG: POTRA domain-containing protein, partial [Polyangiales bacterium]
MPEPPPPATRPVRTSPEPQRPPPSFGQEPDAGDEGEDYEPVEDPNAAIRVPRTSCHGKEIRRIVVIGARRVDPDDVRVTMKLRKGSTCTDPAVTRDARALWNMAYFDDLQIESDPLGAGIKLTIRLIERPAIRNVVYKGNDEVDKEDIDET